MPDETAIQEIPTPTPEAVQPTDPEPASIPETDASQEPAEVTEEQPADEGEAPADLSDDDWSALREKYPDRFPDEEKIRAAALKQAETPQKVREADPLYRAISQEAQGAYQYIQRAQQKLAQGEALEDPDALMAVLDTAGAWQATSERRGQLAVNRAVFERAVGIDGNKLDDNKPFEKSYADLLTELETEQQNAYRQRQSAVREYDPRKRAELITKADTRDATATGNFFLKTIEMAVEHGKSVGSDAAEKSFDKRIKDTVEKASTNGTRNIEAKVQARLAGGRAMSTATTQTKIDTSDPVKLNQRIAYGVDTDGNKVTDADHGAFKERYPG